MVIDTFYTHGSGLGPELQPMGLGPEWHLKGGPRGTEPCWSSAGRAAACGKPTRSVREGWHAVGGIHVERRQRETMEEQQRPSVTD